MDSKVKRKSHMDINKRSSNLNQLKNAIMDCLREDGENLIVTEAEDILNATVLYLKNARNQKASSANYQLGFKSGYTRGIADIVRLMTIQKHLEAKKGTKHSKEVLAKSSSNSESGSLGYCSGAEDVM